MERLHTEPTNHSFFSPTSHEQQSPKTQHAASEMSGGAQPALHLTHEPHAVAAARG